jgi:ankyrin repeat protein
LEKWIAKLLIPIFVMFTFAACGNPPEEARIKLGQMNVKFNEDSFVARARDGDIMPVKLFLQAGMGPNVTNKNGETPLGVAARFNRQEVAEVLLAHGANPNTGEKWNGATPLIWASVNGYPNIVKLLLEKGADVQVHDSKDGMTALMSAAVGDKTEVIKLLLEKKAEVNATDNDNRTALMWAAHYGRAGAVQLLLDIGADPAVREKSQGLTALIAAAATGKPEVVKLLLAKGAAQNGRQDVLPLLLEKGADVRAKDKDGKTALDLTREYKEKHAEEVLLKAGAPAGEAAQTGKTPEKPSAAQAPGKTGAHAKPRK